MRQKKLLFFPVIVVVLVISSCFPTDPPYRKVLPIPYYFQEDYNYCAVACIQMWADWDGACPTQDQIANFVGVGPLGALPDQVVQGVRFYTASVFADIAQRFVNEPGGQGDVIAATVTGIKYDVPSIMPFYGGTHSVLVRGYEGEQESLIAEALYIHDPYIEIGPDIVIAADLKDFYFTPVEARYFAIVGDITFLSIGTQSHNDFIEEGGAYYGGPSKYDPKGLMDPIY